MAGAYGEEFLDRSALGVSNPRLRRLRGLRLDHGDLAAAEGPVPSHRVDRRDPDRHSVLVRRPGWRVRALVPATLAVARVPTELERPPAAAY